MLFRNDTELNNFLGQVPFCAWYLYGIEYTEPQINDFSEGDTRDKFDEDDYRILVVANKYLTGFGQSKLTAMYVDRKLQGVQAVQPLSRLNRSADRLGKKSEDFFVLDFLIRLMKLKNRLIRFILLLH